MASLIPACTPPYSFCAACVPIPIVNQEPNFCVIFKAMLVRLIPVSLTTPSWFRREIEAI